MVGRNPLSLLTSGFAIRLYIYALLTYFGLGWWERRNGPIGARSSSSSLQHNDAFLLPELLIRILADEMPPTPVMHATHAVYVFHEQDANLPSIVSGAVGVVDRLRERGVASRVLVTDVSNAKLEHKIPKWSGAPLLLAELRAALGDSAAVELVEYPYVDRAHTLREAQAIVRFARDAALDDLIIVAAPFHLPRAFITTVSEAQREYASLNVWAASSHGAVQGWDEPACHSQGLPGLRRDFINSEMRRIATYTAKGDLAPVADVLRYLDARGGGGGGGGDGGEAGRSEGELDERREEGDDEL
tara:strand:+ start:109 stop:1014 length:906 start_codon:yes stop_codon:yes gene_type:complete